MCWIDELRRLIVEFARNGQIAEVDRMSTRWWRFITGADIGGSAVRRWVRIVTKLHRFKHTNVLIAGLFFDVSMPSPSGCVLLFFRMSSPRNRMSPLLCVAGKSRAKFRAEVSEVSAAWHRCVFFIRMYAKRRRKDKDARNPRTYGAYAEGVPTQSRRNGKRPMV